MNPDRLVQNSIHNMKKLSYVLLALLLSSCLSQEGQFTDTPGEAKLIVLAPADEQIALVQYRMDSIYDRTVHVFATEGTYLDAYLSRIEQFNSRTDSATSWNEVVESEGICSNDCWPNAQATLCCYRDLPPQPGNISFPASKPG